MKAVPSWSEVTDGRIDVLDARVALILRELGERKQHMEALHANQQDILRRVETLAEMLRQITEAVYRIGEPKS